MDRSKKIMILVAAISVIIIAIFCSTQMISFKVVRVVDGDTIIVNYWGHDKYVRLIGVDTPESVNPDQSKNVPFGKVASKYTKEYIGNNRVQLDFDNTKYDKYGRLLAYVYVNHRFLNDDLVRNGYAKSMQVGDNTKYADDFYADMVDAQYSMKGMWK